MANLTPRQTKVLARFWQWVEDRGLDVSVHEGYAGHRREQPSTGIVLTADWNDFEGSTVRPFHGMPRTYEEARTRGTNHGRWTGSYAVPRKREWEDILERVGIACEWSDEWAPCEVCNGAYRTEPDGFCWTAEGTYIETDRRYRRGPDFYCDIQGSMCLDCLEDEARGARQWELEDARERALPIH